MKRKRFSVEQIVAALKQAELGMPVAELIRRRGISEQTFYRCKNVYSGMESDQVRELKQLQDALIAIVAEASRTRLWPPAKESDILGRPDSCVPPSGASRTGNKTFAREWRINSAISNNPG